MIHRRLCDLHDDGIRRLAAMKIPGMPRGGMFQPLQFCRCCSLAKSTAADICRQSTRDHDPPTCFYMMGIDLWGPVDKAAIGGYKHVLGSIDYLFGYHLAELLRTKDEAASAWRRMLLQIRTLGYSVMVVRVENDSVLLSASFRDVCNEFNVDIQRTAPYRHHQLTRNERHWRTVADAVTALLTDAALLWPSLSGVMPFLRLHMCATGCGTLVLVAFPFRKSPGKLLTSLVSVSLAALHMCMWIPLVERSWSLKLGRVSLLGMRVTLLLILFTIRPLRLSFALRM